MPAKACRTCKVITTENACPVCKGSELSEDFLGFVIILNPSKSQLAEKMKIKEAGQYALKIR
ncbi:DNA-directed RNA polymerase subunit E'' [Candidatus Bathyarchaeota archaeon RBG_13_52_12]|nr:MAG: DNA-directed RNA polymerase subunit E'' [Candidatus Bathyarchaeota archaeon RBG_13_52_12]